MEKIEIALEFHDAFEHMDGEQVKAVVLGLMRVAKGEEVSGLESGILPIFAVLKSRLEERRRKEIDIGEKSRKAANARWHGEKSTPPATIATQEKHGKKVKRFVKPTEDEVFEYMCTYTAGVLPNMREEAQKFIDHYEANGWMVGKNKMKDWKASVRNWIKRLKEYGDKRQQRDFENLKNGIGAIREIREQSRYEREHGEENLPF